MLDEQKEHIFHRGYKWWCGQIVEVTLTKEKEQTKDNIQKFYEPCRGQSKYQSVYGSSSFSGKLLAGQGDYVQACGLSCFLVRNQRWYLKVLVIHIQATNKMRVVITTQQVSFEDWVKYYFFPFPLNPNLLRSKVDIFVLTLVPKDLW